MSDQEINIAIAEACGWESLNVPMLDSGFACYAKDPDGFLCPGLPNYCNDLNAMHEAEKKLPDQLVYMLKLQKVINPFSTGEWVFSVEGIDFLMATARQRAEAFLRTLGKWKEAAK